MATKNKIKIIWANCKKCNQVTRHSINYSITVDSEPNEYPETEIWQIIRCLGCQNVAFRYKYIDQTSGWMDDDGEWHDDSFDKIYPSFLYDHNDLDEIWHLPHLIRKVYQQTLTAHADKAFLLVSVGLRATIEAICNHLKIPDANLEKRIELLFKNGHISNSDKGRLHAIRFLGNDAAHDIKEPKENELRIALSIIEHLLNTLFILEEKSKKLEKMIEKYEDFKQLLSSVLLEQSESITQGLGGFFGKRKRQLGNNFQVYESKLIDEIQNKIFIELDLGPIKKIDGKDIQLFVYKK